MTLPHNISKQVYEYLATTLIIFDFHGLLESVMRFLHSVQAPAATRQLARMSASPPEVQSYGKIQVHRGPPLFLMVCKRQLKKAVIVWIPGLPMYSDKTYCTMADCTFGGWETRSACGTVGDDATFDVLILHVLQQPQNLLFKTAAIV